MRESGSAAMKHVRDYCAQVFERRDERYRQRLSGWRKLVFDGLRVARPILRPLRRVKEAWKLTRKHGAKVGEAEEISKWKQFMQQVILSLRLGVRPEDYYQYRMYRKRRRSKAGKFISHSEMDALLNPLVEDVTSKDAKMLRDKVRFWRYCKYNSFSAISIVAVVDREGVLLKGGKEGAGIPNCDLISKPADWGQGFGIRLWRYDEQKGYRDTEGDWIDAAGVIEQLKAQSNEIGRRIVLQPRLYNHQRLEQLAGKALASARLITVREPEGEAEYLIGVMGLPVGSSITSNLSAGGLAAPIDEESGKLGAARQKDLSRVMTSYVEHPVTERKIKGFQLPYWEEAVELVKAVHNSLSEMPFVGWDVAF